MAASDPPSHHGSVFTASIRPVSPARLGPIHDPGLPAPCANIRGSGSLTVTSSAHACIGHQSREHLSPAALYRVPLSAYPWRPSSVPDLIRVAPMRTSRRANRLRATVKAPWRPGPPCPAGDPAKTTFSRAGGVTCSGECVLLAAPCERGEHRAERVASGSVPGVRGSGGHGLTAAA